jgi:hypothetical protein
MKVYITKTFESFLNKNFSNYYIDYFELSEKLKYWFLDNIYLKRPIMKFKIKINNLSYRIVWIVKWDIIVPIVIFLKKDKTFWENLIWNKELEILINYYSLKIKKDLDENKYFVY